MDKPLVLKKADFCKGLVNLINDCGLPAFIVADVIRDLSEKVNILAEQELKDQTVRYYKALEDEKNGDHEDSETSEESEDFEESAY